MKNREDLNNLLFKLDLYQKTRPMSIAYTKLEESKMWLGKHMDEISGRDDELKSSNL